MNKTLIILLALATTLITPSAFAVNRVLSLDGDGDYVEIKESESLNTINSQVTMEAWIKPATFTSQWICILFKGDERNPNFSNRSYGFILADNGTLYLVSAPSGQGQLRIYSPNGMISLNRWYHVAGVIDAKQGVMRLFINGMEIAHGPFGNEIHASKLPLRIGFTHEREADTPFVGQIDEVRIWDTARTPEAIRATMHTTLSGKEPGLVGYWQFEDKDNIATDSSPSHADGKMMGDAHCVEAELPTPSELLIPTAISGRITAEDGKPIQDANVRLEQDGEKITQAQSDAEGNYWLVIPEKEGLRRGLYDLSATKNELGDLRSGIRLRDGESRTLNLTLKEAISIEGKLMMLDDMTPHVAVVVQAVSGGERIATVLSDEEGKYRFINLKPGQYQVRCYSTNGYVYYQNGEILRVQRTSKLSDIDFRMAPFKKGVWRHYTSLDGLAYNAVNYILAEPDGTLLFGTDGNGVSRYDGQEFISLTDRDGLPFPAAVWTMYREPDGPLWLGTWGDGVVRYDGDEFVSFTTEDGLVSDAMVTIYRQPNGEMWFGAGSPGPRGVSRYEKPLRPSTSLRDGTEWISFATQNGFPATTPIHYDPDGRMWFRSGLGGICYYDGNEFVRFDLEDGLAKYYDMFGNSVTYNGRRDSYWQGMYHGSDGVMWLKTSAGIARYDGQTFATLTPEDGLPNTDITAIGRDSDGALWLGIWRRGGVSRYDGKGFINFTTHDGLLTSAVKDLHWDADGALWVATGSSTGWSKRGGVSRYDGKTFINFTTKDGLSSNHISALHRHPDGSLWIGTVGAGVSHYNGNHFVHLTTEHGLRITVSLLSIATLMACCGLGQEDGGQVGMVSRVTMGGYPSGWNQSLMLQM